MSHDGKTQCYLNSLAKYLNSTVLDPITAKVHYLCSFYCDPVESRF